MIIKGKQISNNTITESKLNLSKLTITSVTDNGTVLNIQGVNGQLFSIDDTLVGDLFTVSDISGMPILNVNSDENVDINGDLNLSGSLKNSTGNLTFTDIGGTYTLSQIINSSTAETSQRISTDNVLTSRISIEEVTRSTGLSTELLQRVSTDNVLTSRISTEEVTRSTGLSTELLQRVSTDNVLTSRISTEEVTRSTSITTHTHNYAGSSTAGGSATTAVNISNIGTVTLASANESDSITVTSPSRTTGNPVKLLNFDWYGNMMSVGNIRSSDTNTEGLGFYYTPSGGSKTEVVRIGKNNSTYQLYVTGKIYATSEIYAYSDQSVKTNLSIIDNPIEKIKQINGYTFNRIDIGDGRRYAGVIAQEIEKVLPEVINQNSDGTKSVAYGNIVALLIEAIKELQLEIEELKKMIK